MKRFYVIRKKWPFAENDWWFVLEQTSLDGKSRKRLASEFDNPLRNSTDIARWAVASKNGALLMINRELHLLAVDLCPLS